MAGKRKRGNAQYFAGESNGIVRSAVLQRKKKEFYRNAKVIQQFKRVRKREEKALVELTGEKTRGSGLAGKKRRKSNPKVRAAEEAAAKRLNRYEAYFKDGQSEERFASSAPGRKGASDETSTPKEGRMMFKSQRQRRKERALEIEKSTGTKRGKKKRKGGEWAESGPADLRVNKPDPFHKEKQAKKCVRM